MILSSRRSRLGGIALAIGLTLSSHSQAFEGWGGPGVQAWRAGLRDCGADIARVCPDVVPGGGRILQCLVVRRERLSPSCGARIDGAMATRNAFFACNADAARICPDVRPGGGRIVRCLLDNEAAVSRACLNALDEAQDLAR